MRRAYLLMACMLLFGLMGCGKEETTTEATTQEQTTEAETEVTTQEPETEITAEVTTQEQTEDFTETATEEMSEKTVEEEVTTETAVTDTAQGGQNAGTFTPDQALELIVQTFGEVDEQTGNTYSFSHVNTMTVNGEEYYVFVWSWLVDGHVSHLTDLFVKTDGSAIYEGMFVGDGATVYTETNHLK